MLKYATRLPPGKPVRLLSNGLIRKTCKGWGISTLEFMEALVNHFIINPDPLVVPVSNFRKYTNYSYSYDMMRCGLLSSEEKYFIDEVSELHDKYKSDSFNDEIISSIDGQFYKKKFPELYNFLSIIVKQDRYFDIHSGNILLNEDHNYCLIDLEGFLRTPLQWHKNDWITKSQSNMLEICNIKSINNNLHI